MNDETDYDHEDFPLRTTRAEDVPALAAFIHPFVELERLLPRTEQELVDLTARGFIIEHGGLIVGFAALEIYSKKLAEVRSLAVSPIYRGHGLGKRLVQACIELAKEHKVLEVMAITSRDEFFKACGFDFTLPGEKKALFIQPE